MVAFRSVSYSILYIRVKACVVVGYSLNEGDSEERDKFWNDMDRTLKRVDNWYRLIMHLGMLLEFQERMIMV